MKIIKPAALIAAILALGFFAQLSEAQCGSCYTHDCNYSVRCGGCCSLTIGGETAPKPPASPAEKLKIERKSYADRLDSYLKAREEITKQIDDTEAQIKAYDDALAKLAK